MVGVEEESERKGKGKRNDAETMSQARVRFVRGRRGGGHGAFPK